MRRHLQIIVLAIAITFVAPTVLSAGDDLLDGTWDLDVSASKFDPGELA